MEGDYNIVMVSAIYQHVQYFFLLFFSPQVSGEPTPIAIVSAKGPEDQEDMSTSLLTCSLTLSLSCWPWFCLLGINFCLAPLALPYPCHGTLSRGWGCVASDRPRRQMAHSSQAGLLTEGINGTVEEDDSVCCVFPKGYLAKELRANSSDSGIQTSLTWRQTRGKVGLWEERHSLLCTVAQRKCPPETALASAPLWRFCHRKDTHGPGLSGSYELYSEPSLEAVHIKPQSSPY